MVDHFAILVGPWLVFPLLCPSGSREHENHKVHFDGIDFLSAIESG